jgi:hypothetical protein
MKDDLPSSVIHHVTLFSMQEPLALKLEEVVEMEEYLLTLA